MDEPTTTLTISQLIALLQERLTTHGDLPVLVTWEGTTHPLAPANVYRAKQEGWQKGELLIDADENFYKGPYAADPTEGETGEPGAADT